MGGLIDNCLRLRWDERGAFGTSNRLVVLLEWGLVTGDW